MNNDRAWSSALFPTKPERSDRSASALRSTLRLQRNPQPQVGKSVQSSGTNCDDQRPVRAPLVVP